MFRPRLYFTAGLLVLAILPYDRAASAQRRRPPVTQPVPPTVQKPAAPAPTAPTAVTPAPVAAPSKPGAPAGAVTAQITRLPTTMPTISYGPRQPRDLASVAAAPAVSPSLGGGTAGEVVPRLVTTLVAGQNVTGKVLHLRGLSDIEKADSADLPEGARRLLLLHVGKIAAAESDHYIVNTQLAEEWFRTHGELPPHIKPPEKRSKSKGCSWRHISVKCAQNEAEQALDKASDEWENLRREAEDRWNSFSNDLSEWAQEAVGCFADKTLSLNEIPVQFSIAPSMSIPIEGPRGEGRFGASGQVNGSVGLGFPMQGDFSAQLDLFYIPCLPFVIRPKALAGDGTMTVGERLTATVSATGSFDTTFTIPPGGGPSIPIYMIPIIIAGVPVAELDISAYIEGTLQVGGKGKAEASFQLDNSNTVQFAFACNGGGCSRPTPRGKGPSQATTLTESAGIEGQVFVKPAIYTALELNFYFGALSARAGPQPYLLGAVSGCARAAGEQTLGGGATQKTEASHALTADLDWGIELRAEALVGRQRVGDAWVTPLMEDSHIWFRDLAPGGSTALVALVEGAPQVVAAQAATYKVRMPSCYPYTDRVRYQVTWTGDATPAATPGCNWQAGQGTCNFDPKTDLVINLTWPTAGSYSLTVLPIGDDHRRFDPEPGATQLEITVVAPGGG